MPTPNFPFNKFSVRSLFLSSDEKRLVFYNPKGILLLDIESQQIINTIEFNNFSSGVVFDRDKIIILFVEKA